MIRASHQRGLWELVGLAEAKTRDRDNGIGPFELTGTEQVSRHLDCPNYDYCLNFAAEKRWESFGCEGCRKTEHGRFEEVTRPL